MQERLGVRDIEDWARKVVSDHLPEQHRAFHTNQPFLVVSARDRKDRPWVTLLDGPDSFVTSPDPQHLVIASKPAPGDALEGAFEVGADIGILGIELATRRRNRVNGRVVATDRGHEVATEFLDVFLTRKEEQLKFLDWLAWCLQNEGDKPAWAPFFYSSTKGSGKSTLSKLVGRLFGEENTVTLNGVEKLTSRFNTTVLTSKLVILEEVSLKTESPQSNAMKTFITEKEATVELKGQEAERVEQLCCFLLTTNHLPTWIEKDERRYYLIDVDHDGHASGPKSKEFAGICARLHLFLENDKNVATLYADLMQRQLAEGFSAKTLNIIEDATPLMKQIQGASEITVRCLLEELLNKKGQFAVPEADVAMIVTNELGASINSTRHLMSDLGWSKKKVKWSGKLYARSIWIKKGFDVSNGKIFGPDSYEECLNEHLKDPKVVSLSFDELTVGEGQAGNEDLY